MPQLGHGGPRFKCKCGKVYAMSEADADGLRKFIASKKGHDNPVRYYKCKFGGWHWTRMLEVNKPLEGKVFKQCGDEKCTNIFEANPISPDHSYCSKTCTNRAKIRRKKARLKAAKAAKRNCERCGEEFDPVDPTQRLCTKVCRQQTDMDNFAARHRAKLEAM